MNEYITCPHHLASLSITKDPELIRSTTGMKIYVAEGETLSEIPRICPICGGSMHIHSEKTILLKHLPINDRPFIIKVKYLRTRCVNCEHIESQKMPFKAKNHNITTWLAYNVSKTLADGETLKKVGKRYFLNPNSIVKDLDYKRLKKNYDNYKPTKYCKYIGIDEFLLHKHHKYATVVIDLESGDVLYLEEGKKKEQAEHFMNQMGNNWMEHVKAVAMDMNAQWDKVFQERYPKIDIVYDKFHLIALANRSVITNIRRRLQNKAKEESNKPIYNMLKGSRFLLVSNRSTLQKKDSDIKANNKEVKASYIKGIKPKNKLKLERFYEQKLNSVLAMNRDLNVSYFLLEQLKYSYEVNSYEEMENGFKLWLNLASQSKIPEIKVFRKTVINHLTGILNHAIHHISTGKVEGTNQLIKTLRRRSYGYRDTEYFFLKIMEASRKNYVRSYKSHTKIA